jgi:organic hydroperoxide reductase OsmC/OhrA
MLVYLHLCATAGVVVESYEDSAEGTMVETADGGGHFTEVVLRPQVAISSGDPDVANRLHEESHHLCYIANSVNFEVRCVPALRVTSADHPR